MLKSYYSVLNKWNNKDISVEYERYIKMIIEV